MKSLQVAILLLALPLPAQVIIYSDLGETGDRVARRLLKSQLPDQPFVLQPRAVSVPDAGGLLLGVDSIVLLQLSETDALLRTAIRDLGAPFRGPDGSYAITLLSPYVSSFNQKLLDRGDFPGSWDDLLDPRYQDHLAVGTFQAMPDLWMTWIGRELRRGEGERRAVAWLTTLDARIASYAGSADDVRRALLDGTASFGILPRTVLGFAQDAGIGHALPTEDIAAAGLGVAWLASEEDPATAAVHAVLVGQPFNRELAEELQLVAVPRLGIDRSTPSVAEREVLDRLHPLQLDPAVRRYWLELWEADIRGRGRDLEDLNEFLDMILAILFLCFLFFVYTRIRKSEGRRARSE